MNTNKNSLDNQERHGLIRRAGLFTVKVRGLTSVHYVRAFNSDHAYRKVDKRINGTLLELDTKGYLIQVSRVI